MQKRRLTLGRLLFILLVLGILYFFFTGYTKLRSEFAKNFVSFPKVTNTYSDIFSKNKMRYLVRDLTFFSRGTNPVATFKDKRDNERIMVFKFDFHTLIKLEEAFEISNRIVSPKTDEVYNNTRIMNNFDIYRSTTPLKFKNMILSFNGEQFVKITQNDSLVCYRGRLKAFTVSERENGKLAVYMKRNGFNGKGFSQLLLLKKGNSIYLLFKNERPSKSTGVSLDDLFIN